jgi:hypothetical protein
MLRVYNPTYPYGLWMHLFGRVRRHLRRFVYSDAHQPKPEGEDIWAFKRYKMPSWVSPTDVAQVHLVTLNLQGMINGHPKFEPYPDWNLRALEGCTLLQATHTTLGLTYYCLDSAPFGNHLLC